MLFSREHSKINESSPLTSEESYDITLKPYGALMEARASGTYTGISKSKLTKNVHVPNLYYYQPNCIFFWLLLRSICKLLFISILPIGLLYGCIYSGYFILSKGNKYEETTKKHSSVITGRFTMIVVLIYICFYAAFILCICCAKEIICHPDFSISLCRKILTNRYKNDWVCGILLTIIILIIFSIVMAIHTFNITYWYYFASSIIFTIAISICSCACYNICKHDTCKYRKDFNASIKQYQLEYYRYKHGKDKYYKYKWNTMTSNQRFDYVLSNWLRQYSININHKHSCDDIESLISKYYFTQIYPIISDRKSVENVLESSSTTI